MKRRYNGRVKKLVLGIGINDTNTVVSKRYKSGEHFRCPYYSRWYDMLTRVSGKVSGYKDVALCDEWRLFSNFKSWMEKQDWEDIFT